MDLVNRTTGASAPRISVSLADSDLTRDLVSHLRCEGYLVVEPEISDLRIYDGPDAVWVRVDFRSRQIAARSLDLSAFINAPVTASQVLALVRRLRTSQLGSA